MSGRGSYGRGGRGFAGCSGGRGRFDSNKKKSNSVRDNNTKKEDDKFAPHQVGKQPTVTYDTVKERIEQYIQKNYSHGIDLAESLREGVYKNLAKEKPMRKLTSCDEHKMSDGKTDEFMMKITQDELDLEYQQELRDHS